VLLPESSGWYQMVPQSRYEMPLTTTFVQPAGSLFCWDRPGPTRGARTAAVEGAFERHPVLRLEEGVGPERVGERPERAALVEQLAALSPS
jgi:hypothetical protein